MRCTSGLRLNTRLDIVKVPRLKSNIKKWGCRIGEDSGELSASPWFGLLRIAIGAASEISYRRTHTGLERKPCGGDMVGHRLCGSGEEYLCARTLRMNDVRLVAWIMLTCVWRRTVRSLLHTKGNVKGLLIVLRPMTSCVRLISGLYACCWLSLPLLGPH